jgi:NADH-quinone oxidoreductase subunit G
MGEDAIEAGSRGVNTVIGTYDGWLNCSQCGNCIEVCPTGTLLDATYRHEARPWELEQNVSTCTYCSDGCQLSVGARGSEVLRVVARDRYVNGINGEFLCIKGRFAHHFVNSKERIKTPLVRYKKGGKLIPTTWDEAIRFVASRLNEVFETSGKESIGFVGSPRLTNESLFTLRKFANEVIENNNYAVADAYNLEPFFANLSAPLATHKDIRYAKTILLIGGNPKERQPLTDRNILQAVRNGGANLIVVNHVPIRTARRASQFVHINADSYDAFVLALTGDIEDGVAAGKIGIEAAELQAVRDALAATKGDLVIILGNDLSEEAQAVLAQLATRYTAAEGQRVLYHPLPLYNNSVGAVDMTGGGRHVTDVLRSSRALYLAGSLLLRHLKGHEEDLNNKDFIVVQELFETDTTKFADVVLPAASFAEQDGTYTNNDGLVQRVRQAIAPLHQAKPDWAILAMIAKEFGVDFGYNMASSAVFKQIADSVSAYAGLRYPSLKDESNPVQVKHEIFGQNNLTTEISRLKSRAEAMSGVINKIMEEPAVGSELHVPGTLTSKTPEFQYLFEGNAKPENILVSPLIQIERIRSEEMAVAAD